MANPLKDVDWENWIYGLLAGAIGGGSAAVTGAFAAATVDSHFALGTKDNLKLMGAVFAVSAAKDFFLYLKQNPLPKWRITTVETTTTETTVRSEK